jgi:small subunit ribosomal protein S24e
MEVLVISEKQNPMLKRKEVSFQVEHGETGCTPSRVEIRKAVAVATKTNESVVFLKKYVTKTGTLTAFGTANIYDTIEQAKLIEPKYIVKRNVPEDKNKEAKEAEQPKEAKGAKETREEKKE